MLDLRESLRQQSLLDRVKHHQVWRFSSISQLLGRNSKIYISAFCAWVYWGRVPNLHVTEIGAMLLFFMLLKSAILCDLYLLTYIICAIETPCDANLFFPFVSIHFFNSRCCFQKADMRLEKFEQPLRVMRVVLVTIVAREMRLKFFEVDQALEMLRVALVTILAREMRLKIFWSRPSFGDVASGASHDIGARNAIENFLKSTKLWRCCEWRQSRYWREKWDWIFLKLTKLWRCCEWRLSRYWREKCDWIFLKLTKLWRCCVCLWSRYGREKCNGTFFEVDQALEMLRVPLVTIIGARNAIEVFQVDQALQMLRVALVTILVREMRLKFFEVDQRLEMLRVALVMILVREMRLKVFSNISGAKLPITWLAALGKSL